MWPKNAFLYSNPNFLKIKMLKFKILKNEFRMLLKVPQQDNNHVSIEKGNYQI